MPSHGQTSPNFYLGTELADQHQPHLGMCFTDSAMRNPTRPALIDDEQMMTYQELAEWAQDIATFLSSQSDWTAGERIAIRLPNSAEYIAAFYGILLAGGVVVPLPVEQTSEWVDHILQTTQCRWLIDQTSLNLAEGRMEVRDIAHAAKASPPTGTPENLAAIFFTSGSSGTPKGVMLSHRNLLSNASSIGQSLPLQSSDRALAVLPFCHAFGNSILQSHLLSGAALVCGGTTAFPESLVEAMERHSVTSLSGVPDLYRLLLDGSRISARRLPSLRYATVAGGALRPDLTLECADRIAPAEFFVMYGQTEATARLSCLPAEELHNRCGSIGRGIPGVTLEVVDEQGSPVSPGALGEIRASGPNLMLGYWNDPTATQQVLRDGWLYTGDLATVDPGGYIFPRGRTSQLLKIGGYRLHPAEIESVIAREIPTIDPIVVPFETPEQYTRLALFVIPLRAGMIPALERIRACCQKHLARHQRPEFISILGSPPLTASLKVDRTMLSRWATEAARQRMPTT